ncbi:MAG: hypothetical protein P8N76_07795 [Pirellulaceae bacterium]|nr:hypothetical protein [Pirellulaceae bacterium]
MWRRFAAIICISILTLTWATASEVQARGGLGAYHAGSFSVAPMGAMGMQPSALPGSNNLRPGFGSMSYHPSVGYYHAAPSPFTYSPYGGYHYNESYANPYTYQNPYQYHQFSNPYRVPFTTPF